MTEIRPAECCFDSNAKTLRSTDFDDIYFCDADALAESEYVFIDGNDLRQRWSNCEADDFTIIETGFGSGLNFILSCREFLKNQLSDSARLNFISFEKYPIEQYLLEQIHRCWDIHINSATDTNFIKKRNLADELIEKYPPLVAGMHKVQLAHGKIDLYLYFGDAAEGLAVLAKDYPQLKADAVFLDGFAPEKNPDMWDFELFEALGRCCKSGASLATFTAAGPVKRGLRQAGFFVKRRKGFGNKWHMITGLFRPQEQ